MQRKKSVRGFLFRYVVIFIGILVIASLFQFGAWVKGPEILDSFISTRVDTPEEQEQSRAQLAERLGFDHSFIPDLWPFDNTSIWK